MSALPPKADIAKRGAMSAPCHNRRLRVQVDTEPK